MKSSSQQSWDEPSSRRLTRNNQSLQTFQLALHSRKNSDTLSNTPSTHTLTTFRPYKASSSPTHLPFRSKQTEGSIVDNFDKSSQQVSNFGEEIIVNRPSDLFTNSQLLTYKDDNSHCIQLRRTTNTLTNYPDVNALLQENAYLRNQVDQLRTKITKLRGKLDDAEDAYSAMKQHRDRTLQQKQQIQRGLEKTFKQLEEHNKLIQQCKQQGNLYREISDNLQKRVELLLKENKQLRVAIQKTVNPNKQLRVIHEKYEKVRAEFTKLEREMEQDGREWERHKHVWIQEREYYKEIIRKLEFQLQHS